MRAELGVGSWRVGDGVRELDVGIKMSLTLILEVVPSRLGTGRWSASIEGKRLADGGGSCRPVTMVGIRGGGLGTACSR